MILTFYNKENIVRSLNLYGGRYSSDYRDIFIEYNRYYIYIDIYKKEIQLYDLSNEKHDPNYNLWVSLKENISVEDIQPIIDIQYRKYNKLKAFL